MLTFHNYLVSISTSLSHMLIGHSAYASSIYTRGLVITVAVADQCFLVLVIFFLFSLRVKNKIDTNSDGNKNKSPRK